MNPTAYILPVGKNFSEKLDETFPGKIRPTAGAE